ncbi:hypothetical protein Tco_1254105 [Tanacetum coccineum]
MCGSSSQRRTYPPMSPIHAFPIDDMYTPEFSGSFQQNSNTSSFQEIVREDSPVEVATSLPKMKKPTRNRLKRTIQSDDTPRQTTWTNGEEIALCKSWVHVSENSSVGNARKNVGFWCEESGAFYEDYYARELVDYESRGGSKRNKSSGSSSFNTESGKASINLNANVGDDEEDEE